MFGKAYEWKSLDRTNQTRNYLHWRPTGACIVPATDTFLFWCHVVGYWFCSFVCFSARLVVKAKTDRIFNLSHCESLCVPAAQTDYYLTCVAGLWWFNTQHSVKEQQLINTGWRGESGWGNAQNYYYCLSLKQTTNDFRAVSPDKQPALFPPWNDSDRLLAFSAGSSLSSEDRRPLTRCNMILEWARRGGQICTHHDRKGYERERERER